VTVYFCHLQEPPTGHKPRPPEFTPQSQTPTSPRIPFHVILWPTARSLHRACHLIKNILSVSRLSHIRYIPHLICHSNNESSFPGRTSRTQEENIAIVINIVMRYYHCCDNNILKVNTIYETGKSKCVEEATFHTYIQGVTGQHGFPPSFMKISFHLLVVSVFLILSYWSVSYNLWSWKKKTNNWIVINIMSGIFMNGILYLLYELTRFGPHTPKPYIWISDELDVVVWNDLRICVVHHPLGCSVESSTICPGTWTRFEKYRTYHISCLIN